MHIVLLWNKQVDRNPTGTSSFRDPSPEPAPNHDAVLRIYSPYLMSYCR